MVSTTDDAEFTPCSAAQAARAPAGPEPGALRAGLGVSQADAPVLLLPPLPEPVPGEEPPATRGHPGGPGFPVPGVSSGASVWQQAQAAWLAAGAEWFSPAPPPATPATSATSAAPATSPATSAASVTSATWATRETPVTSATPVPAVTQSTQAPRLARWNDRTRTVLLLLAVAVALAAAAAGAGYQRLAAGHLSTRGYPAAQLAGAQFSAAPAASGPANPGPANPGPAIAGRGVFQALTQVASSGSTVVAVGSQAGGDLTRAQFLVSTDAGQTWQLAAVHAAGDGEPAPGHPAQLVAGPGEEDRARPGSWLAVGPHSIWTSKDARSWTLAATTGITPTDAGDQVRVLTRTAYGWLAAGQNTAEATGVIWTSRDGLHWQRVTAAQAMLPSRNTIVSITGAVASGQTILLSGQVSRWWDSETGPLTTMTWLSTNGGWTWRATSVPVSHGAGRGLAGIAAAGPGTAGDTAAGATAAGATAAGTAGFVAIRPGTAPSGPSHAPQPAGVVYWSANGLDWQYVNTLTSGNGMQIKALQGNADGVAVLGEGPGGALYGYASGDGVHWKPATSFGPAPGTVTGTTLTSGGAQIAAGATGTPVAEQPFLSVAPVPGQASRAVSAARIAGGTITQTSVDAVAVSGSQYVAVGETGGTLAAWSGTGGGPFSPGTWATATGTAPPVTGTQQLTSVVHGPAGWLATGEALAGSTPHPVVVSSADGHTWAPHRVSGLTGNHLAVAQAAADRAGYVVVGSATTSAGTFPAAWSSRDLRTWTRAAAGGGPGGMLAVAAGSPGFVAVGAQGIDPAAWTSADGRHWAAHTLNIPGTGATARLAHVAVSGRTVVAFGSETWASGRRAAFAEVSSDGGRTWRPVPLTSPGGPAGGAAEVTAVTAVTGGFTAVGSYGPPGDRDVAVWTSVHGDTWRTQAPHGTGLSGPGVQQVSGLAAAGTALTGVGFTATSTAEQPTLWRVPAR